MHRRALIGSLAAAMALIGAPAFAADTPTGFLNKSLSIDGTEYRYVVYVPRDYTAEKEWPVILFLHGAGERGSDGLKQTEVGLGRALRLFPERYPAIVVMPQCATGDRWAGRMAEMALRALDRTLEEYRIDRSRQYLTGLSMGGFGSWLIASQHPSRFAAVVPICGGGDPAAMASKLKDLPIWTFHGDADEAVPVARTREMVDAIKAAGGERIRYTEYPGVGHNSWDRAYASQELTDWLFAQKRP